MAWCAAALEGLNDDHVVATARAGMREHGRVIATGDLTGLIVLRLHDEPFARSDEVRGTSAIGEQPGVVDAIKAP